MIPFSLILYVFYEIITKFLLLYPVKVRVKFSFRSQRYKNTKVTVHFNRGETLSGAMTVLKNLVPGLEYEVRKDEVILK